MVQSIKSLKSIFLLNSRANVFLPSGSQITRLLKSNYEQPLTMRDWYNVVKSDSVETSPLFTSVVKKDIKRCVKDQDIRAETIITNMIKLNKRRLVTMDGHGRFVLSFINKLIDFGEDLNKWSIELIDIDKQVHDWHGLFLPKCVSLRRGNIMDIATPDYLIKNDAFLYMNFCGVGNQYEELTHFIMNMSKHNEIFMLSYSKRGVRDMDVTKLGQKTLNWMNRILSENNINQLQVCARSHFITKLI